MVQEKCAKVSREAENGRRRSNAIAETKEEHAL
jgi:hypothetical protein